MLHNKLFPTEWTKAMSVLSSFCMSQECRFWHRTSPEVAQSKGQEQCIHLRKNQPGLQRISFQMLLIWLLARDPFLSVNLSTGSLCAHRERERGKRVQAPLMASSQESHSVSSPYLCNSSKLLGLATLKKRSELSFTF